MRCIWGICSGPWWQRRIRCRMMGMCLVYLGVSKNHAPFLCVAYGVAKETTEHEAYNTNRQHIWPCNWCSITSAQKYKGVVLSENLRHPLLCFARWQAAQCCQLLHRAVRQGPRVPVQSTAVNITSLLTIFRKAAEEVCFGLQKCVKCSKQVVHCNSKFYNLIKPK